MTRKEKISQLNDIFAEINEDDNAVCYLTSEDNELIESAIEALSQESCYNPDEWCTDCSEYNQDKHCCPRYNKVIRHAVEEMKQEPCEDAVSRKAVINQIFYSTDNSGDVVLGSALRKRIARLPSVAPQEPCEYAISRYDALKLVRDCGRCDDKSAYGTIYHGIEHLPPVQSKTKTGHWIHTSGYNFHCSECDFIQHESKTEYKYCPNCGAKMESEDKE